MTENLKAAAYAAGLSEKDKRKIDNLSKALSVHKQLLNMPQESANAIYNKLPQAQQQNLVQNFGAEPEKIKVIIGYC
jgi:malonyl CoA-acyl carrier protein transacylase